MFDETHLVRVAWRLTLTVSRVRRFARRLLRRRVAPARPGEEVQARAEEVVRRGEVELRSGLQRRLGAAAHG